MRKRILAAVLATAALCLALPGMALAETISIDVTDCGADGTDTQDDVAAINRALLQATGLDDGDTLEVTLPAGTYYLSSELNIYSNTTLIATGATLISTDNTEGGCMIYAAHLDSSGGQCACNTCTHKGYTQCENITINGGTWDRGAKNDSVSTGCVAAHHGTNLVIENATFEHSTNHLLNISGMNGVTITNCKLKDQIPLGSGATAQVKADYWLDKTYGSKLRLIMIEAIHPDFCSKDDESGRSQPLDGTATKNVTVSGCSFDGCWSAFGTHHYNGTVAENMAITGCTFKNMIGYAVNFWSCDGLTISNNTGTATAGLVHACGCDDVTVSGNSINASGVSVVESTPIHMVYAQASTAMTLTGNTLSNAQQAAISASNACTLAAKGNAVSKAGTSGIRADTSCTVTATGNKISSVTGNGIQINGSKASVASNTVSNCADGHGIIFYQSSGTITSNTVTKAGGNGIEVDEAAGSTKVYYNTVTGSATTGLMVSGESKGVVANGNYIGTSSHNNVYITESSSATLWGNWISGVNSSYYDIAINEGCTAKVGSNILGARGFNNKARATFANYNGWQRIQNTYYYLKGVKSTDVSVKSRLVTGWQKISGKWYWFSSGGAMATNWKKISGSYYYFGTSGAMVTGWKKVGSSWYWFTSGGVMVTGWKKISGTWYYFGTSGAMVTGTKTIGGKTYTFDKSGALIS